MRIYTFCVHNLPLVSATPLRFPVPGASAANPLVRAATRADAEQITALVSRYAAEGLMLPRTREQVVGKIDNYVVATDAAGRVVACAALEEYSPSLAEVSSVAVAPSEHGKGLGTQVVLGVERLARARDIDELFALTLTDNFFLALGYKPTTISRYPEKLARYRVLTGEGVEIVPKRCFRKQIRKSWSTPRLVEQVVASTPRRKRRVS